MTAFEALLASREAVRAPVTFTQVMERDPKMDLTNDASDLVDVLVSGTAMYAEWNHIDGVFEGLYETIPGRFEHYWAGSNPEAEQFSPRT